MTMAEEFDSKTRANLKAGQWFPNLWKEGRHAIDEIAEPLQKDMISVTEEFGLKWLSFRHRQTNEGGERDGKCFMQPITAQ